jgi:hypothetical protein
MQDIIIKNYQGNIEYNDAYYRGAKVGGAMGTIVRETFGI